MFKEQLVPPYKLNSFYMQITLPLLIAAVFGGIQESALDINSLLSYRLCPLDNHWLNIHTGNFNHPSIMLQVDIIKVIHDNQQCIFVLILLWIMFCYKGQKKTDFWTTQQNTPNRNLSFLQAVNKHVPGIFMQGKCGLVQTSFTM